jgi:hypothetical protein
VSGSNEEMIMPIESGRSGASAPSGHSPSGLSQSPLSQAQPNVPNAETLVRLMSAWCSLTCNKFEKAYPFFEADIQRTIKEYDLARGSTLEAAALLFAEYADSIVAALAKDRLSALPTDNGR